MKKVCLVTTTFSQSANELRFQLALKTCREAAKAGYPIFVVDGSPHPDLRELLLETGAIVVPEETKGMGASRRQVLRLGLDSGAEVIVWLEPEKYPVVPLLAPCIEMIDQNCGIVMPARQNLESYPRYQELSELRAMREIGIISGRPDLDWMFGPRVLSRDGAELLLGYTGQAGGDNWEILFIPILWALKKGLTVACKRVDYVHPPEQTEAEEGDEAMDRKRDIQREVLIRVMREEARKLGVESLP